MRINFLYNFKKVFNKLEIFALRHNKIESNLFLLNKKNKQIKSILLFFPDYEMMHYGDHLFFEPLARNLRLKGYQLYISPIKAMEFYFQSLGYKIAEEVTLNKVDLIITRVEFIKITKKIKNQILLIDTVSSTIKLPLCNDIIEKVSNYLGDDYATYDSVPAYYCDKNPALLFLNKNDKYIIFNNYIDSGSIRSGSSHQKIIIDFVKNLKSKTGLKVIHTGSNKDKNNDFRKYDFVDIDIRGKTSIKELFTLCSLHNILYNVSFDGFQMHLFLIQKKKSFVLFRGRFLKKNEYFIKKYVNPPFFCKNSKNLIEYIG
jgi:hypothetical protein